MTSLASILPSPAAVNLIRYVDRANGRAVALEWTRAFVEGFLVECSIVQAIPERETSGMGSTAQTKGRVSGQTLF